MAKAKITKKNITTQLLDSFYYTEKSFMRLFGRNIERKIK